MPLQRKKIIGQFQSFIKGSLNSRNGEVSLYHLTWIDSSLNVETSISIPIPEDEFSTLAEMKEDKAVPTYSEGGHNIIRIPSLPSVKVSYKGQVAKLPVYSALLKVDQITPVRREEAFRLQHITGHLEGLVEIGGPLKEEPNLCAWLMLLLFFLPLLLLLFLPCGLGSFFIPIIIALIYCWLNPWICERGRCAKFVIPLVSGIVRFRWILVLIQVCVLAFVIYGRSYYYEECFDFPSILWGLGALALCFWSLRELRLSVIIPGTLWLLICLLMTSAFCDFIEERGVRTLPNLIQKVVDDMNSSGENEDEGDQDDVNDTLPSESDSGGEPPSPQDPPDPPLPELPLGIPKDANGEPMCSFSQELSNDFIFDTKRSTIRPNAKRHLKTLTSYISHLYMTSPGLKVIILGYADHRGSDEDNKILSRDRALSIRKYLNILGVNRFIVSSKGEGEIKEDEDITDDQALSKYRKVIVNVICEEDQR